MWIFDQSKCVVNINPPSTYQFISDTIPDNKDHQILRVEETGVWIGKSLNVDVLLLGTFMVEKIWYRASNSFLFKIGSKTSIAAGVSNLWKCVTLSPKIETRSIHISISTNTKKIGTEDRVLYLALET